MSEDTFVLEPQYNKCVIEEETWKKDSFVIKRAIGWRHGKILVSGFTEEEIREAIKKRDTFDRVCVSDKFEPLDEIIDKIFWDSFSDDLSFSEDMHEDEINRLNNLFSEEGETAFEEEGWEIYDTDLYFESNINIYSFYDGWSKGPNNAKDYKK